jgi:LL-diaminopimelate aminotransferase
LFISIAMKEARRLAEFLPQLLSEINKKKQEVASLLVDQGVVAELNRIYQERKDIFAPRVPSISLPCSILQATSSIWTEMPKGDTSAASFTSKILQERGVLVTPDKRFSAAGESFIQSRIMVSSERLREAGMQS